VSFTEPPTYSILERMYIASLPEVACDCCGKLVARRVNRMTLRASWRESFQYVCVPCWQSFTQWAAKFALQQLKLPLL
jgi:hypothetical protein